jgi:hypothetical protein
MANDGALGGAVQAAFNEAIQAAGGAGNPDAAYKAFMAKLGEGLTQAVGDAIGAAVGSLRTQGGGAGNMYVSIADTLSQGATFQITFPSPGLIVPMTQKVSTKFGGGGGSGAAAKGGGGSVGVTGSYTF